MAITGYLGEKDAFHFVITDVMTEVNIEKKAISLNNLHPLPTDYVLAFVSVSRY